jgi:hypothetical protein
MYFGGAKPIAFFESFALSRPLPISATMASSCVASTGVEPARQFAMRLVRIEPNPCCLIVEKDASWHPRRRERCKVEPLPCSPLHRGNGRLSPHLQDVIPEIQCPFFTERRFRTVQGIPVRDDRVRHAESFGELDVWSEIRPGDVAHGDAEIIDNMSGRCGEDRNQSLLGVAFNEDHAAGEQHLGARCIKIRFQIIQLVRCHRQVSE